MAIFNAFGMPRITHHIFLTTIKSLTLVHLTIYKEIYQNKFWVQGIFKIFKKYDYENCSLGKLDCLCIFTKNILQLQIAN